MFHLFKFVSILSLCTLVAMESKAEGDNIIDLSGTWQFSLDSQQKGIDGKWFNTELKDSVNLPGSLQEQGHGYDVSPKTSWIGAIRNKNAKVFSPDGTFRIAGWLQPEKHYVGLAWYRKEFTVPQDWEGKNVILHLERVHITTRVWLDGKYIGDETSLSTPHEYYLGKISAGTHTLSILTNNRAPVKIGNNSHCYSDHTQTAWNGIVGKLELRAVDEKWIDAVSVFPNVKKKEVRIKTFIKGAASSAKGAQLRFEIKSPDGADKVSVLTVELKKGEMNENAISLGRNIALWDEFNPDIYRLTVSLLNNDKVISSFNTQFGMVEYKVENQKFVVNGRISMFRGTLDCAAFPMTGYPSMDIEYWKRVFRVCKAHGLNHVRYHSWFPPEVALFAADEIGIYLQCEHAWCQPGKDPDRTGKYLYRERDRVIKEYGNHPSFAMHAYGNEPYDGSDEWLPVWVAEGKKLDEGRRLYTAAAGYKGTENSDYIDNSTGMRAYDWGKSAHCTINKYEPNFNNNFRNGTKNQPAKGYVSHENGQWCVYPSFDEIKKYTGFLKARNYEIFKETIEKNHMGDLAKRFFMASGRLQTICYKHEIEMLLRTEGLSGYQLLGLNDFPGQGTALVGPIDVFWDTKEYTSAEEYDQFNGKTVPLANLPAVVFKENETSSFPVQLAHYDAEPIKDSKLVCRIESMDGKVLKTDTLTITEAPLGLSTPVESYKLDLAGLAAPAQYRFVVSIPSVKAENRWDFWIYPGETDQNEGKVKITRDRKEAMQLLQQGETVLLVPEQYKTRTLNPATVLGFSTIFWNTAWSKRQPPTTMGILCDPRHPMFEHFPTEYHSNYQWWYLIKGTVTRNLLHLDGQNPELRPCLRVIDDWFTARRVGLMLEAAFGKGKLMISTIDISRHLPEEYDRKELVGVSHISPILYPNYRLVMNQFRMSVLKYMNSGKFNPAVEITGNELEKMFGTHEEEAARRKSKR